MNYFSPLFRFFHLYFFFNIVNFHIIKTKLFILVPRSFILNNFLIFISIIVNFVFAYNLWIFCRMMRILNKAIIQRVIQNQCPLLFQFFEVIQLLEKDIQLFFQVRLCTVSHEWIVFFHVIMNLFIFLDTLHSISAS